MSTKPRTRKSASLVLYGIVFRTLCRVAFRAPGQNPVGAARQHDAHHRSLPKERAPLSLKLDAGQ